MKKLFIFIASLCLIISVFQPFVLAVEPYELLPVDVVYYPNHMEIRKIYEMAASVDPDKIPRISFKRDDISYKCTDILREVIIGDETKPHIETETIDSKKNDIESILSVLPMTKEILTEDGFFGILYLNTSTIKSEIAGYGSTTSAVSTTRTYPNLYDMDSQHIPKSVTESGITYTLSDIQWRTDNSYNIDDYEIGSRYTAIAVYSGAKSSSYVKGYKVTAEYTGELCRTGVSVIRYTVIFSGTKIEPPQSINIVPVTTEPGTEAETINELTTELFTETATNIDSEILFSETVNVKTSGKFNWLLVVIPLALLTTASIASVIYMYLNKRKETTRHEETIDYDYIDTTADDNNDNSCNGGSI